MRLADYPRATNRALINGLFNGEPPYTEDEVRQNNYSTNCNFLESTKMAHDARRQFYNALCVPDPVFFVKVDRGPKHKRQEYGMQITKKIGRIMKDSPLYHDLQRGTGAQNVLHGIAPSAWEDLYSWCPQDVGIEDILVPANTLTSMRNCLMLARYRQYTAKELWDLTHKTNVDPGWNMDAVKNAIKWADDQARLLMGTTWPEVWSPEKMEERIKGDGGLYASDVLPTIDCFDFYFWKDDGKKSGWRRRIILDAWGQPGAGGANVAIPSANERPSKTRFQEVGGFLYDSKDRVYADKLSKFIHFQFADCSSVAPFRYHSVRSLGMLLYAVCHLQNRLRCKVNDATMESLLQYFRVANPGDMDRLNRINLIDKGVLEEGLQFVRPEERWQVNEALVSQTMQLNRQTMSDNSSSFTQDFDFDKENQDETATRTMAKVNATAALVGAMLNQAYNYRAFQDKEIARRFCLKNSRDPEVRKFRAQCLKDGMPEEILESECWDIQPNRVIGGGNKTLQVAIADKLMGIANRLDPQAQQEVNRMFIAINSDDWDLAERLVPEQKKISDATHDAQLAAGVLMDGLPLAIKEGINHIDYIEALLADLGFIIQRIEHAGGMATQKEIEGMTNMVGHIKKHIEIVAADKQEKERVKKYMDLLGGFENRIKAYTQRLQEEAKKQAQKNGEGGPDPEAKAKSQSMLAQNKMKLAQEPTPKKAQKQLTFEQQMRHEKENHHLELDGADFRTAHEIGTAK